MELVGNKKYMTQEWVAVVQVVIFNVSLSLEAVIKVLLHIKPAFSMNLEAIFSCSSSCRISWKNLRIVDFQLLSRTAMPLKIFLTHDEALVGDILTISF
jgi:hypothetical protein